ncbi:MAG: glycosyltransferase [bacterium]
MKKIAIIKSQKSEYYGEKEKHLITLAVAWQENKKEIFICSGCKIFNAWLAQKGIKTKKIWFGMTPIGFKNSIWTIFTIPFLLIYSPLFLLTLKFFKKIDTVYLINIPEKIFLTIGARIIGINVIWEEYNIPKNWSIFNPYRLIWMTSAKFAKIFTYSSSAKNILAKKLLNGRIEIIYPGINLSELQNQGSIFNALAEQNAQNKNIFKIGTICHLSKKNGLEYLLQAIKIVAELIPLTQLVIVGTGEERFNLSWLVRKLGIEKHIWFMGYQDNYYHWLKSFDLFAMPALNSEGINIEIIEAMAYSCPIIASDIQGINEIVKNNFSGILIEPANPEILAQSIIQLYRNKEIRKEMGQNGYNRVKAVFNIDRVLEDMEKLM